ncbi:MAG: hypothetical protein M1383_03010 [Patescibacteria group bacterium]|nr:hypothetical protein [Patescibacteria group bacterium]
MLDNNINSDNNDAGQQEQPVFFNVMPKVASSDRIKEPVLQTEQASPAAAEKPKSGGFPEIWKKYKIYIISGLALLILGPAAYFGSGMLTRQPQQDDDNLLLKTVPLKSLQNDASSPTGTPATEEKHITQQWKDKYFPGCQDENLCGEQADPDRDGLDNLAEFNLQTDPNNADSDQDGLADGDEAMVFGSDPLEKYSAGDTKYSDADFIKGGYSITHPDRLLTPEELNALSQKMNQVKLHQPTVSTLGQSLSDLYRFGDPAAANSASSTPGTTASTTAPSKLNVDLSPEAKQDRDTQRSLAIKSLGIALVKYFEDNKIFPSTSNFKLMADAVKPYLKTAVNTDDPLNQDQYVYSYETAENTNDFTLSYYSESVGQIIKKHYSDAQKDKNTEDAAIYDNQRKTDLEMLRTALLLYSNNNIAGNQDYVFPITDKYKTSLVPSFISQIPKDPKTGQDYEYQVSGTFNTFTLKTPLDNPAAGTTGYLCNQEECRNY